MAPSNIITAELAWVRDLVFDATSGSQSLAVDGDSAAGASPVQLLAVGLAACMAIDVVDILRKGRHPVTGFRVLLSGERSPAPPRRLLSVEMRFRVHGPVPEAAVDRALTLSREKYCSVWHSLRTDIRLQTAYEILS